MINNGFLKEFMTINEFAEFVGITASALRHYDNKGIFRPAQYGNMQNNKYRYYSPTQITTVKRIRVLTETGVPLGTIKEMAESRTPEKVLRLLTKNKNLVADEIRYLQDVLTVVETFIELLTEGLGITETEITTNVMSEKRMILGDKNHFENPGEFLGEFLRFRKSVHEPPLNMSYPVGAFWPNMTTFSERPSSPERFFSLDPKGSDHKSAGLYLNGYIRGYYGQAGELPTKMQSFAKKNGLRFTGAVYGTYLFDELSIIDPNQYLAQISASVTEIRRVSARRPHTRHLMKGSHV